MACPYPTFCLQIGPNSNPFLNRLLNRETITRISYKSNVRGAPAWLGSGGIKD